MRKIIGTLAILALASAASGQTVSGGAINCCGYDDGQYENCWKVSNPSGASDYFNVDCDGTDCHNMLIVAICVEVCETKVGGVHGSVGIYHDNLGLDPTGQTPDLGNPVCPPQNNPTGLPGTFCTDVVAYDIPDCKLKSTDVHAVYCFDPGDTAVWVCADASSDQGRSFFSADGYNTPALPFTLNWAIRLGAIPCDPCVLWINGGKSTTIAQDGGVACFLFTTAAAGTPLLLFVSDCATGALIFNFPFILFSGFGAVDDGGTTASFCGTYDCSLCAPITVCFIALKLDITDPKPNGNFSIKATNSVTLNVTASRSCTGCGPKCFGQKDDGVLDSTIWKVMNPAGSGDYFNVHYGVGTGVTNLENIEIASWDFCGAGPSWGAVLSAEADTGFDPSGGTPNIATPVASATTLNMSPGQSDWAYPATAYEYADVPYGGQDLHGVAKWTTGDSCTWMGSDTDFIDSTGGCPENGASYFTADGYSTIAIQFFGAAWMIKQNWN